MNEKLDEVLLSQMLALVHRVVQEALRRKRDGIARFTTEVGWRQTYNERQQVRIALPLTASLLDLYKWMTTLSEYGAVAACFATGEDILRQLPLYALYGVLDDADEQQSMAERLIDFLHGHAARRTFVAEMIGVDLVSSSSSLQHEDIILELRRAERADLNWTRGPFPSSGLVSSSSATECDSSRQSAGIPTR